MERDKRAQKVSGAPQEGGWRHLMKKLTAILNVITIVLDIALIATILNGWKEKDCSGGTV